MNMETRKSCLKTKLTEKLGAEYKVIFPQRLENENEKTLMVGIKKDGEAAGIWTYLSDSEIECLDNEAGTQSAVTKVIEEYQRKSEFLNGPQLTGDSFDDVKSKIVYTLYNGEENTEALEHIPYIRYYDMVAYFRILVTMDGESYVRTVLNEDLSTWGVNLQDVLEAAKVNTPVLYPPVIQRVGIEDGKVAAISIGNTLDEMLHYIEILPEQQDPMYVLSSKEGQYGAIGMIDNHLLERISDSCNDSLVILPKDIHELILIPSSKNATSIADWKDMIHAVNDLNRGEKLSELIYLFDRADMRLRAANDDDFQA